MSSLDPDIDRFVLRLCIQFHWQLETANSRFWLVNIMLRKFDTSSKKEMKMIKIQNLWRKTKKQNKQTKKNKQKKAKKEDDNIK